MLNSYPDPGLALTSPGRWWRTLAVLACSAILSLVAIDRVQAQVVPLYGFSSGTSPYQPLAGATTFSPIGGGGTDDDGYSVPQTIPFGFQFGFNTYTTYIVNTNGWITFGPGSTTPYATPLNGSVNQMIGFFAKDLRSDGPSTVYSSITTGTAPNRIHKIQAAAFTQYDNTTATGNAQLWLYEGGKIEMRYGTFTPDWIPGSTNGVQVGLRGSSITDIRSLSGSWGAPIAGSNAADLLPNNGAADRPTSGQLFTFTLPTGDLTPPVIGNVTINPLGGTCLPSAHTVTVSPTDASGLFSVQLVYTVSGNTTPTTLAMTRTGSSYSATIPAQGSNGVTYFVRATDNSSNRLVSTSPTQSYRDASLSINAGPDQTRYVGETATLTASTSLGGTVRITEVTLFAGGTGATNPYPSFIAPGTEDFVEITNMGTGQVDISNYGFEVQGGSAARTYSFPVGTVIPPRSVLVLHIGSGTDDPTNLYFHTDGPNDQLASGNDQAFVLTSPSGQVVDAVVLNGFPVTAPVSAADWSGTGTSSPRNIAGAGLYGADVNSSVNWSDAQLVPQSIGTLNAGLPTLTSSAVQWTGTGLTGTVTANPLITPTYTTAGTYTYTASITSGACTITDQVRVTVLPPSPPTANFTADRTSITINDFTHLIDQSTNRPLTWRYRITPTTGWQFIAGTSATSPSPYVLFTQGGQYTVKQIVSNGAGRDSLTRTNYINVSAAPRYCENINTSPCTTGYIDGISILGTTLRNRGTGCSSGPTGTGFTRYPALDSTTATLRAGLTYSITAKPSATGSIVAWIDFNNDGVYDSVEYIPIALRPNVAGQSKTYQFTVPITAVPGEVGMRVRSRRAAGILHNDACITFFDGETEDYTLTLIPGCTLATPTVTSNGPLCAGQPLTLSATNLTSGATLTWSGPNGFTSAAASPQITNTTAATSGTYTLTVSKDGCSTSGSVSVIVNTPPTAPTLATNGPVCAGQLLTLTATNLSPGATLAWTGPNNFTSTSAAPQITAATAAASGTYTLTLTRAGCSTSRTINVAVTAAPAAPSVTGASRCGTGPITLTASGASGAATYKWYATATATTAISGATSATYTPTVSATTTYYVAIASGTCESPRTAVTATVTAAPAPTITATGSTTVCQGEGVLLTAANGGTGANYLFYRNNQLIVGTSGATYTATQSGTYTVSASAGSCGGSSATGVVVTVTPAPAAPTAPAVTRCGTGTVTLTASGAPTGGGYRWYATSSSTAVLASTATYVTPSISGVATYYVSTTTSGGCESPRTSVTAVANNNPTPTLVATGATTFCDGGAVTLTASGGATNATYQFLLNGQPVPGATGTTYSATQGGTYTVVADNGSNCTATSTATVAVTVNPAASAAFAYPSSTYCLSGANPTPAITGTTGGTFSVTPSTGLALNPTTGAINLANSSAGTYTITYAVGGQCPASLTQTVTLSTAPAAAFTYPTTGSLCTGVVGSLTPALGTGASAGTFSATPAGLSINASNGTIDLATSQAGTYTITNTIAASGSCAAASATASLTLLAAPTATVTADGPTTFCDGGSVVLTATGGTSYLWSNGATTASITVTSSGSYSVTATNAASCSATSTPTTVTVNPTQSAAFTYAAATFCLGGTNPLPTITGAANGTFTATAGLAINNATGAIDLTASAAGTYTVTYSTGLGSPCPVSATQTVTLTSAPSAAFSYSTTVPACAGSASTLLPTLATGAASGVYSATPAGLTINAATGEVNLATSAAGTYTITNAVASSGSCPASSATSTLTVGALPVATVSASGPLSFCDGDSVVLSVGAGGTILWSTGASSSSITVRQSGTYSVTVSNATGCEATSTPVTVTATPRAAATFAYDAATYCLSGSAPAVSITGTTGGTFSATPAGLALNATTGAIDLSASTAGTYTVTYAVSGACGDSQTRSLTLTAPAVASFSYASSGCAGSTGTLSATLGTGATAGTFSTPFSGLALNATTGAIDLSASQPGTYDVINTLPASGSCGAVTDTAQVTINAQPVMAFAGLSANYCAGDGAVTLAGTIDGTPVTSTTGSFTIDGTAATQLNPSTLSPGTHTVVLTGSNGTCTGSASLVVTVTATPAAPTVTQAPSGGFVVLTSSATTGNLWYYNGTPIPGAINSTYTVTAAAGNGNYTVVSTTNGCPSAPSGPIAVTVTGIAHAQALALPVSLYPNPTLDGLVTVELPLTGVATPLTVFDITGRPVFTILLPANETKASLDLHQLPVGVYVVRLQTAGGTVIKRLVRD